MSKAEVTDINQVLAGYEMDLMEDNNGNNAISQADFNANNNFRKCQLLGVIAKEHGSNKEVLIKNTLLKLPLDPRTGT